MKREVLHRLERFGARRARPRVQIVVPNPEIGAKGAG
jgi:hypothetical protein